jgi:hypothetical protein
MKVKIQMTIESEAGEPEWVHEVAQLERGALRTEALGLTLAEAKSILGTLQHTPGREAGEGMSCDASEWIMLWSNPGANRRARVSISNPLRQA